LSSDFIFSLAEEGEFIIFNAKTGAIVQKKQFTTHFESVMHPTTYINKLLFSGGSKLELWNVIDDKLIYNFPKSINEIIACVTQSPVLNIVAIGFSDGSIKVMNLQTDQVLLSF
jgi:U3 small nucleolar RNA-associated protein 21